MAQGLLFRKDMPPAGVFLLMLAGWVEELGGRTQRRHRKTIILVVMQEIGTVIQAKQDTQKELCASLMPGRSGVASIMSIIAARPGPGGQHHEHHWRLVSPFRGKPKHSLFSPAPFQSGRVGKMRLQVQSSSGNRHPLTGFKGGPNKPQDKKLR